MSREVAHTCVCVCVCYMAVTSITNNCHVWSCLNLKKVSSLAHTHSLSMLMLELPYLSSLTLHFMLQLHYTLYSTSLSFLTLYTFMLQLHYTLSPLSYSLSFSVHAKATISHTLCTCSCYSYSIHYTQPHSHTLCSC